MDHIFIMIMPDYRSAKLGDLATGASKEDIEFLTSRGNYGDYVFLQLLSYNMDHITFSELICDLVSALRHRND
jgi:hypothetical protein